MKAPQMTFIAVALAFGCESPQDATPGNFEKALQAFHDEEKACLDVRGHFPMTVEQDSKQLPLLDELVAVGLLESEATGKEVRGIFRPKRKTMIPVTRFSLTDEGKSVSRAKSDWSRRTGFCFGTPQVVEVETFTEPSEMLGRRVSRVHYSYAVRDIADWADSEVLRKTSTELAGAIASQTQPKHSKTDLVLMNNGWMHHLLAKRR